MKVYIVRHGKPEGVEKRKRYLGATNEALSMEGMRQADETGRRIADAIGRRPSRLISSPLIRCLETARVLREHLNCVFTETDSNLKEINMGIWDGRYFDEIQAEFPAEYEARGRDLWNYKVPEGESFAETGRRFLSAFQDATKRASEEDVIILVSHAGAIRAGMSLLTDTPFEEWMGRRIPYAGAIVVDLKHGETGQIDYWF